METATVVSRGEDVVTAVCALRQRRGQFDPQTFSLLRSAERRTEQHVGPPSTRWLNRARYGNMSRSQRVRCCQPSEADHQGTPCPTKRNGQATAVCSQESSTAMAQPTRAMTRTCAWQVFGGEHELRAARHGLWNAAVPHPRYRGLFMFLRIAHAPAQYVTDSSIVEQGVNQRGRMAAVASTSAWADLWRDVWCVIDAWRGLGYNFSVREVKAHTTPEVVLAGIFTADVLSGNDLADAACKLMVMEHRSAEHSRSEAVTRMAHWIARVGSASLDIDSAWIPGRATARRRERERPWPLPVPALPTSWRRGHTFVDSARGRICALCQHPERVTRGRCPGAAGARERGAAQRFWLDGSACHIIVDLLQGYKVVSVLCVVCGSYSGRVVRKSLRYETGLTCGTRC